MPLSSQDIIYMHAFTTLTTKAQIKTCTSNKWPCTESSDTFIS